MIIFLEQLKRLARKTVTPSDLYKSLKFTRHWRAKYLCRFGFHSKDERPNYICKQCGNTITKK